MKKSSVNNHIKKKNINHINLVKHKNSKDALNAKINREKVFPKQSSIITVKYMLEEKHC